MTHKEFELLEKLVNAGYDTCVTPESDEESMIALALKNKGLVRIDVLGDITLLPEGFVAYTEQQRIMI